MAGELGPALEVRLKAEHLRHCIAAWNKNAAEHSELRRHRGQVASLAEAFESFCDRLAREAGAASAPQAAGYRHYLRAERELGDAYALWNIFRQRLGQRLDPSLRPFLHVADSLARGFWEPAHQALLAERRRSNRAAVPEPLVAFSEALHPQVYRREDSAGAFVRGIKDRGLEPALRTLPLALVELHFSVAGWAPQTLMLAHEIGHCVEKDLELEAGIAARIDEIPGLSTEHRSRWKAWKTEVVADLYGVLVAGPPYAWTLFQMLLPRAEHSQIRDARSKRTGDWGESRIEEISYPTGELRLRLVAETLVRRGFAAEAEELLARWRTQGVRHTRVEYEADVATVCTAVLEAPIFESVDCLQDLGTFGCEEMGEVRSARDRLLTRRRIDAPRSRQWTRLLFSALQTVLWESEGSCCDPETLQNIQERVVARAREEVERGHWAGEATPSGPAERARNRKAGEDLFELLARSAEAELLAEEEI